MIRNTFLISLLLLAIQSFGESTVSIKDAVEKKMIEYKIVGSWDNYEKQEYLDADGQYFGKCMTIKLESRIDSLVFIFFDNGLMLMCEDTATQDMIITKPIYVQLRPRQTKVVQLYAMCTEIHNGMPHREVHYKVGNFAGKNLVAIAKTIDNMFMNNIAGQGAIWAYSDKATEGDLIKYGATENSLHLTIEILNKAGVETKLNPPITVTADTSTAQLDTPLLAESNNDEYISIDKNVVYGACVILVLSLGTAIVLIIRRRKPGDDKQNIT